MGISKPEKPYKDFPLFPHARGKWAKKINGRMMYFGRWEDPDGALSEYTEWRREQAAEQSELSDALKLSDACNMFLLEKKTAMEQGKLASRSYTEYRSTMKFLLEHFGRDAGVDAIGPLDLAEYHRSRSKVRNLVSMGNECVRIKTLFTWLQANELIEKTPRYPEVFRKPNKKEVRRHKRKVGSKVLTSDEVHQLLAASGVHIRAMIMLGINAAFSPSDIACLRIADWDGGEALNLARVKTEIDRKCFLWPETIEALETSLSYRFEPASDEDDDYFFLKSNGRRLNPDNCEISKWFKQIREWSGVSRATFYHLRHTHQNIGESVGDAIAVKVTMGHSDQSISDVYRHDMPEKRIRSVTDAIRDWFNSKPS